MLGRRIDAHFRRRPQARHRGRVDDGAATLGEHQRQLVFHAQPDPFDVDSHDGVELGFTAFSQAALFDFNPGVVERIVDAPIGRHRLLDHRLDLCVAGDVAAHELRLATGLANRFSACCSTGLVHIGHHHLQPLFGKRQRRRTANARCTTRNQCNLTGKTHAHARYPDRLKKGASPNVTASHMLVMVIPPSRDPLKQ